MIFLRHPFDRSGFKCLEFKSAPVIGHAVRDAIVACFGYNDFQLLYNGRKLQDEETLPEDATVHATFRLPGGKGGFGSMLRAIGAQIEKTTNREACRDLSGRRLRDINEEQRLKKWIAKEAEREAEKVKRRQARIERLKSKPAHKFFDFDYEREISALPERVNDALSEGLQKVKQPSKRSAESSGSSKPPKKKWLGDEFSATSSDSDSDSNSRSNESPSKKQKNDSFDSDSSEPLPSLSKEDLCMESEESSISQQEPSTSQLQLNTECDDNIVVQCGTSSDFGESSGSQPGSSYFKDGSRSESGKNSMSQPEPCSSSDYFNTKFINITNSHSESNCSNSSNSESLGKEDGKLLRENESKVSSAVDNESRCAITLENESDVSKDETSKSKEEKSETKGNSAENECEIALPINLFDFQSANDLESLGLEKLKSELMIRGLKCGGTLADRAERLWKIRSLQPHEYPASVLAKSKK